MHQTFLKAPNVHARFQRKARLIARLEQGDIRPTQKTLVKGRTNQPGMAEIELLQGELLLTYGKPKEARQILKALTQRPDLPSWVAQQARELLS